MEKAGGETRMKHKGAASNSLIATALQSMTEVALTEVAFGQLVAIDDDACLTWGFRAKFETDSGTYLAGLKNSTGGNGASCVVSEQPGARVLVFEKYVLQPDFARWVSIAAVLSIELMHTALVLDGGVLKVASYVRNAGRVRTDVFLLDLNSGAVSQADPARHVTTFSGFKIGLPGPGDHVEWVFHTHRATPL
jgi:hypothetical protein